MSDLELAVFKTCSPMWYQEFLNFNGELHFSTYGLNYIHSTVWIHDMLETRTDIGLFNFNINLVALPNLSHVIYM